MANLGERGSGKGYVTYYSKPFQGNQIFQESFVFLMSSLLIYLRSPSLGIERQ